MVLNLLVSLLHMEFLMKKILFFLCFLKLILANNVIFQVSTYSALMEGVYRGEFTYEKLMDHGDFGLGTFNDIDGEMVALDGKFYKTSGVLGSANRVTPSEKTPYAVVTFFKNNRAISVTDQKSLLELGHFLQSNMNNRNTPYAMKVEGKFDYLKLRNLKKQRPPFRILSKAAKEQYVFELKNVEGTLVGFWYPEYLNGINMGGFHFHFIDKERKVGGHVLKVELHSGKAFIQPCEQTLIDFPGTNNFNKADLMRSVEDIEAVKNGF